MQNVIKLSKIIKILLTFAFSAQSYAGLRFITQPPTAQNSPVINFALEWTPEATMNALSVANLAASAAAPANSSKFFTLDFKFPNLLSPSDEEDLKKMSFMLSTKPVQLLSVDAQCFSESTFAILRSFGAEKIHIKYKTEHPLKELEKQIKDWGLSAQNIQLEFPGYTGDIRLEDLQNNDASWVKSFVSNQHAHTTLQTEDGGANIAVNVKPKDLVRNMFSPDGLSKHQAWSTFIDQNVVDPLPLPYFAVPMEDMAHLSLFMQCYRDRLSTISIAKKTAYDPKQNKLEISQAMFGAMSKASDQWLDVLKCTLNEESTENLQNNTFDIENWEHFLKLPYSVHKKESGERGSCSLSIKKEGDGYVFCLGLTQQEVVKKSANLDDTEKTALINELRPWSSCLLNKMGVDVNQLRKDQKISGTNIVKESRWFENFRQENA